MTIYSAQPTKIPIRAQPRHWKSNLYSPERKLHSSYANKKSRDTTLMSIQSLGSLRIKTQEEHHSRRRTECPREPSGKILKGFSEKMLEESFNAYVSRHPRCESAPEALQIIGGHFCDPLFDSIDKVQIYNSKPRFKESELTSVHSFPTLPADTVFSKHAQGDQLNVVTGPFVKLPLLDRGRARKASKKQRQCLAGKRDSSTMKEPKRVFIIPFGAFDDPVQDVENASGHLKGRYVEENTSAVGKCAETVKSGKHQGYSELAESEKGCYDFEPHESETRSGGARQQMSPSNDKLSILDAKHLHVIDTSKGDGKVQINTTGQELKNSVLDINYQTSQGAELCFTREISNASLSNYLKAIPTDLPQNSTRTVLYKTSATDVPRLSYTQRTKVQPSFYMMNNSLHHVTHPTPGDKTNGYVPCKGKQKQRSFYAEITTGQEKSVASIHETTGRSRKSKSSYDRTHPNVVCQNKNPKSQELLPHMESEKSRRLSQVLVGHQLMTS